MHNPLRRKSASQDSGLTLVELAVAVLILSLGTIAALRATDQSRIAIGGAEDRILAQLVARNHAEALQLQGRNAIDDLPSSVMMGGQEFTVTAQMEQTAAGLTQATVSAQSQRGPAATFVIYLGPQAIP